MTVKMKMTVRRKRMPVVRKIVKLKSTVLHSKRVDFEYGVLSAAYTS